MEASTLQAPAGLTRTRIAIGTPLLRLRSDEQLVALFRAGHDEAFSAIHERYHKRLLAYARQMLPRRQDAEDALQDVFVRAYSGLRAGDGRLALRAWLFRVAHNRCIDELRRPGPPQPEVMMLMRSAVQDPIAEAERRESLRRLIADVRRLPDQQRSALLMRELGGMSYAELAGALGVTIPALKSLLVRARVGLVQAAQARDTDCGLIRDEIAAAHDRGSRPNATVRKHMRDCAGCRGFRREVRGISKTLAAFTPAAGPLAVFAHMLGFSGGASGSAGAGSAAAGGAGAAAGSGVAAGGGVAVATGHVATLIAAAVATAGGAVEIQHTISSPPPPAQVRPVTVSPASAVAHTTSPRSPVAVAPARDALAVRATAGKMAVTKTAHPGTTTGNRKHGAKRAATTKPKSSSASTDAKSAVTTATKTPATGATLASGAGVSSPTSTLASSSATATSSGSTSSGSTSSGSTSSTQGSTSTGSTSGSSSGSGTTSSGSTSSSTSSGTSSGTGTTSGSTSSSGSSGSGSGSTSPSSTTTSSGSTTGSPA